MSSGLHPESVRTRTRLRIGLCFGLELGCFGTEKQLVYVEEKNSKQSKGFVDFRNKIPEGLGGHRNCVEWQQQQAETYRTSHQIRRRKEGHCSKTEVSLLHSLP